MTTAPTPKRRGRPPTPETNKGDTPTRSVRIGAVWDEAMAIARERGEPLNRVITRALINYIRRHRRGE